MAINGICLVLAIVGLALVSNRLLDKFEIADQPALTSLQRLEKAQRNQAEYDRPQSSKGDWGLDRLISIFGFSR
jgi:hypothetical protein